MSINFLDAPHAQNTCSRAECSETALFRIDWRNPRIHSKDRTKTWLACTEHEEYLVTYLQARRFPVEVSAIGDDMVTKE